MQFITTFKGGTGPDYVKTVSCRIGPKYVLVVDFYRDIDGNVRTSMTIEGAVQYRYEIDMSLFAEATNHMSEVAHLLEFGEPVLI